MHPDWKERSKTVFVDDMILYIQDTTKNLLELINDFSKLTGQKINIPKSVAKNALTERQVKKKFPFTIASQKNKISL